MENILNSKVASGRLNGVQVVGGSNPLTPILSYPLGYNVGE